jgi:hypothetical protein
MSGPELRAIPTKYQGVEFRSRLEAKWACFFDELGLRWESEPESYPLPGGSGYMPDFLLRWAPGDRGWCWAEVKPEGGDFSKAEMLAKITGRPVLRLEGPPGESALTSRLVVGLHEIEKGWDVEFAWAAFNRALLKSRGHRFWNPSGRGGRPVNVTDLLHRWPRD